MRGRVVPVPACRLGHRLKRPKMLSALSVTSERVSAQAIGLRSVLRRVQCTFSIESRFEDSRRNTGNARGRARQMKTRYSFELWDLCGTSYAPFPLNAPRVIRETKCSSSLSDCHN